MSITLTQWRATIVLLTLLLGGCYYVQAARGQLEVLHKREPIDEVLADPVTPPQLAERLALVQEARRFAVDELRLPDNDSYRSYADLEREFVVWSVFAAEEFSLDPKRWCFPIVGCVAYRGYFREAAAQREADKLAARGLDVFVGGVPAYSTLGRFDDPVLNTMLRWDDTQLVGVLFHELAHQVLYIKDDTAFNEAFATAVEEIGVERFLADRSMADAFEIYRERKTFRRDLMALVNATRSDLQSLYAQPLEADEMRRLKQRRLEQLAIAVRDLLLETGRNADAWLERPFNNARLISFSLYEGWLPSFRRMLSDCNGDMTCYFDEARRVAALDPGAREAYLDALAIR